MPSLDPGETLVAEGRPLWRSWGKENVLIAAAMIVALTVMIAVREGELSITRSFGAYIGIGLAFAAIALAASARFRRQAWIITDKRILKSDGTIVPLVDILRVTRAHTCLHLSTGRFRQVTLKYLDDAEATQTLIERLRA